MIEPGLPAIIVLTSGRGASGHWELFGVPSRMGALAGIREVLFLSLSFYLGLRLGDGG